MAPSTVIFDIGGVILDWVPERAFEKVMPAEEVPAFMERVGFAEWNAANDALSDLTAAEDELVRRHPADEKAIRGYRRHFLRSVTGMVTGTSGLIAELGAAGVELGALTNWAEETFLQTRPRFGVLGRFSDIVVSGAEGIAKPDPAVFLLACERLRVDPSEAVFVDDSPTNAAAASEVGLTGLVFTSAEQLRADLVGLGLLGEPARVSEPVYHLALRSDWEKARKSGRYPWSTPGLSYHQAGFVHLSFAHQADDVRQEFFADIRGPELELLKLDPAGLPIVVEGGFPHLFGPLPIDRAEPAPMS